MIAEYDRLRTPALVAAALKANKGGGFLPPDAARHCPAANLEVEVDGGQHYGEEGETKDGAGRLPPELKGLRFSNLAVLKEIDAGAIGKWGDVELVRKKIPLNPPLQKGDLKRPGGAF